jgi:hypothetical protein
MVSQASSLESRKRKKTADMVDSPPKRVTRARAKVTEEPEHGVKTTIITTASARVAAITKPPAKTAKPAASTKRKTRAEVVEASNDAQLEEPVAAAIPEPPKTRGRTKKTVKDTTEAAPLLELPSSNRGRKVKADMVSEEAIAPAPKPRTRAKKITEKELELTVQESSEKPTKTRATRSRGTAPREKVATEPVAKAGASRKKVTFQEGGLDDKENIATIQTTLKKAQTKTLGLNAKPVRPAATRGSVRAKKPAGSTGMTERPQPLSPKKVTQVAKSGSISSEDELSADKLPVELLLRSPVKPLSTPRKEQPMSLIARLDTATIIASPNKLSTSALLSPARRPPITPHKDVLKDLPKKALFETTAPNATPAPPQSLLKQQPKKANLITSANTPMFVPLQTPLKSSLFASPVRRPMTSFKPRSTTTPSSYHTAAPATVGRPNSQTITNIGHPEFNFSKMLTKTSGSDESSQESAKVHTMTAVDEESSDVTETVKGIETSVELGTVVESTPCKQTRNKTPSNFTLPAMTPSPETVDMQQIDAMEGVVSHSTEIAEEIPDGLEEHISTTPPNEPDLEAINPFSLALPAYRQFADDSDSDDEIQSAQTVALGSMLTSAKRSGTDGSPTPAMPARTPRSALSRHATHWNLDHSVASKELETVKNGMEVSFTPLANQLSSWMASSPEKNAQREPEERPRGIFSPVIRSTFLQPEESALSTPQVQPNFFHEQLLVQEQEAAPSAETRTLESNDEVNAIETSQESFEEYGDENAVPTENPVQAENAIPIDPQLLGIRLAPKPSPETCTPARVFQSFPREIRTVSKVPLRPEGPDSPLKIPRKRSRSVSGPLTDTKGMTRPGIERGVTVISYSPEGTTDAEHEIENHEVPTTPLPSTTMNITLPTTPLMGDWQTPYTTPGKTVRKGADAQILRGAVVFVDVHTTEGADASGIFVELLTSMGARCIKQWTWNPRASTANALEGGEPDQTPKANEASAKKVGITHVVYKDGGKRTLEKVRESKGLVLCVGVGWVLE